MSKEHKAVVGNLYSVHWENDKEHGYFHSRVRIVAKDALDAIKATIPESHGNLHVTSVEMLAEDITLLVTDTVLNYESMHSGGMPDEEWRKLLGATHVEQYNGYRYVK